VAPRELGCSFILWIRKSAKSPYRIFRLPQANILYGDSEHTSGRVHLRAMMHEGARIMSSALGSVDELGAMTVREFCGRYRIGHTPPTSSSSAANCER
jgi:hypothetical protein